MKYGDWESQILKQCKQGGQPLPAEIRDSPKLQQGLELYWNAFVDLNTCRSVGMAAGPIPWDSILKYANEYQFAGFQREALFYHVRAMDVAFLSYNRARDK